MNLFEVGLNPGLKERMSVRHYTLYEDMYDTVVNVERVTKERASSTMSKGELKEVGTNVGITISSNHIRGCEKIFPTTPTLITGNIPALDLV